MDASASIALATSVAAWLTLGVYLAIGFYAKGQLDEYRKQRRESLRPYVVVDFAVEFILKITVSNLGSRPARDIHFAFSEPLTSTLDRAQAVKSLALREGIPMLPPGKRYSFVWDSAPARFASGSLCMTYEVTVEYRDDVGERYCDTYVLDLASLSGASIEGPPWQGVIKAIDELRRETHKWTDGFGGLLVHSRDKDAMLQTEREEYEKWRAATEADHTTDSDSTGP
jgi:hypothetical protein